MDTPYDAYMRDRLAGDQHKKRKAPVQFFKDMPDSDDDEDGDGEDQDSQDMDRDDESDMDDAMQDGSEKLKDGQVAGGKSNIGLEIEIDSNDGGQMDG